jgi:hypothetical protein
MSKYELSPEQMIDILCELEDLGFTDAHFQLVHHALGYTPTIRGKPYGMIEYCLKTKSFRQGHENQRTLRRLIMIRDGYLCGNRSFDELVRKANREIPPLSSRS